ncbi:MAG: DUF4349 domain-containing protein [bacterium]|jgi:hypothetical protein|nr:DUF4349 domain-containing protein [bacterium]
MNKRTKTMLLWTTRGFAGIGALAIIFLATSFVINLSQSSTSATYGGYGYDDYAAEPMVMMADMEESFMTTRSVSPERLSNEAIAAEIDQKIIKTGTLDLVVDDVEESVDSMKSLAQTVEGYVQSSSTREHSDGTMSGSMTIRIPSETFDETLTGLKDLSLVVERETVSAEDVTEQYIDIASRLENAKAQEERYVEILDVATTVEEILDIEKALGEIRGYIESLTGQLKYLDSVTDFSTITVSLSEEPVITVGGKEFRPRTEVKEAGQALIALGQALVVAIIWLIIIGGGVGIPVTLMVWLMIKLIRNRSKR